jgi:predicted ribonuclease YlaK
MILNQLHSAQQEINNLRFLNVCLQSTLLRVQTQLIEYIPDEIKQKLTLLRQTDDHIRRNIHHQKIAFFENFKNLFDNKQEQLKQSIPLSKNEKQIEILFEMFQELNTIIHTEHNNRICQLYITLTQTSHSVLKAREG